VLRAALLASAALGVGLLSACGSGQITGTDQQVPSVPGVNVNSADGKIALRDGVVAYADAYKAGSTVPINVRLFNNSTQPVKLTSVTSASGPIVLVGGPKASTTPTPAATSASPSASGSKKPSGSASAAASPSESPSASPSPVAAGSSDISVAIPVAGVVLLSRESQTYLAVDKFSGPPLLAGGALKNVVFTFTYADGRTTTITLPDLPMTPPLTPLPKPSSVVHGEEGGA
jgi:hypothetical protein